MAATDSPLTLAATVPSPYLHADNRALVLHDGRSCAMYASSSYPWLGQTLGLIISERRATRQQGPNVFGGWLHDDDQVTLYAGTVHHLVTCDITLDALRALHDKLT
jgi:hypothetical protein